MSKTGFLAGFAAFLVACSGGGAGVSMAPAEVPAYSQARVVEILKTLSSPEMNGRRVDTPGGKAAGRYIIVEASETASVSNFRSDFFRFKKPGTEDMLTGINLVARIDGQTPGEGPMLIVTAHYDHMGAKDGQIWHGADDNASGAAALFAIADSFSAQPPEHDVYLIWTDAEEMRLQGARAWIKDNAALLSRGAVNLNLDMIAQSDKREIYAAGTYHTPGFEPLLKKAAEGVDVTLKFGHDRPEDGPQNWTMQSDHGPFHMAGIPFVYFGVEDHPHYHQPTDTFESLPLDFYDDTVELVVKTAHALDAGLPAFAKAPSE